LKIKLMVYPQSLTKKFFIITLRSAGPALEVTMFELLGLLLEKDIKKMLLSEEELSLSQFLITIIDFYEFLCT